MTGKLTIQEVKDFCNDVESKLQHFATQNGIKTKNLGSSYLGGAKADVVGTNKILCFDGFDFSVLTKNERQVWVLSEKEFPNFMESYPKADWENKVSYASSLHSALSA